MIFEKDNHADLGMSKKHIYAVFKQVLEEHSNHIAVIDHIGKLSYEELNHKSDQLAQVIHEAGVKKGVPVLICLPQSRYYVISILAVLKLGAYYIPIDEHYPIERIAYMIKDSGASHILTVDDLVSEFSESTLNIISTDQVLRKQVPMIISVQEQISTSDIACMIYTSGSSGLPKGILLTHRSILNLAYTAAKHFTLSPKDHFLQVSSISFSAALEELYPPLLIGSTIIFQAHQASLSIQHRIDIMHKYDITVCEMVTPLWHELVDYLSETDVELPSSLRLIITGGERLLQNKYQKWVQQEIELIHVYGPTESAATASYYHCSVQEDSRVNCSLTTDKEWRLPIGKAIDHTSIYILDEHLNKVPQGSIGEIYISGSSLASHYMNKPALTAEVFLPNPYSVLAGERMYKTGDQGKYLSDGNLEFIGRIDNQIKIRGYRVEPGEIESVIEQHPSLRQAIVLSLENQTTELQLVAFVVAINSERLTLGEWRSYLIEYLPTYMIPSNIVYLDQVPLTQHGKIDRSVLKMNYSHIPSIEIEYVMPKTITEKVLLSIWKEIFDLQYISCTHDFFDLGGHSLIALRLASRIRRHFNIDIQPNLIMQNVTIVQLASVIEDQIKYIQVDIVPFNIERINEKRITLQKKLTDNLNKKDVFPIANSQNGLWFMSQLFPDSPLYNVPWRFDLSGNLDISILEKSLNCVIQRHSVLQSTFELLEGQPVMVTDSNLSISIIQDDFMQYQTDQLELESENYLKKRAAIPFDLTNGPLIRCYVLRTHQTKYIVLMNIHHIIFDGWSLEIFMKEWSEMYSSLIHHNPLYLADIPFKYVDYSMWQTEMLLQHKFEKGMIYWEEKLKNITQFLDPIGSTASLNKEISFTGELITAYFGKSVYEKLQKYSEQSKATKYMILLTCYKILLFDFTHQKDIAIGAPAAGGRMIYPFDQHIGYFVNTLVIRNPMNRDMTFEQLLEQIKQTTMEAYKYQDIPLDLITQKIKPIRKRGRNPLFQTDFLLEEDPLQKVEFSGLSISDLDDVSTGLSKFDLTWIVKQKEDGIYLNINFKKDFISTSIVYSMIERFEYITNVVLDHPEITIRDLLKEDAIKYGQFKSRRTAYSDVVKGI